jgi:hypothetical protein
MRSFAATCALIVLVCAAALTADTPAQILFNRLRAKVREDVEKSPRYTCVETVVRTQYRPPLGGMRANCAAIVAERARLTSPGLETWHDRLRLDVGVGENSEIFSWAGAKSFETGDLQDLALSGATGSGDFGSFLASVFGPDAEQFRYVGEQDTPLGRLAAFEYKVPLAKSHYSYRTGTGTNRIVGYGGTFYAIPAKAELRRLIVDAHEFPTGDVCSVYDTIDYARTKIGSGDFLLPEVSRMDVLYADGQESLNETHYSGCHEFTGVSTIRFDDPEEAGTVAAAAKAALQSLPAKTRVRVRIDPPISSETGAAGDAITGVVEHDVKVRGQVVVRATDKLHGRILRFEQFLVPDARWVVAIRFDSMERDGVEQPVTFRAVDDGLRNAPPPRYMGRRMQSSAPVPDVKAQRPPGAGLFVFYDAGRLVLDRKFESEWETK